MKTGRPAEVEVKWTDKVQAMCGVLTLVATIIGFIFLSIQITQAKHALQASAHTAIYAQIQTIDQIFVDKPSLRKFFYDNYDFPADATEKEKEAVVPVADVMQDFFEHVTLQRENLPENKWPLWLKYMRFVYDNSPVMRRHLKENAAMYDPEYVKLITAKETP